MTNISNISSTTSSAITSDSAVNKKSFLQKYIDSTPSSELDTKTMFKKLSIDVGSDGKTITKDQLNEYISKAENKEIKVSDDELKGLKTLQSKWDTLALGGDNISYSNVANNKDILTSMAGTADDNESKVDYKQLAKDNKDKINTYLAESAFSTANKINSKSSGSDFSSMLKTLLTGTTDENDDENADLIDNLVNLLEETKKQSTIEVEA